MFHCWGHSFGLLRYSLYTRYPNVYTSIHRCSVSNVTNTNDIPLPRSKQVTLLAVEIEFGWLWNMPSFGRWLVIFQESWHQAEPHCTSWKLVWLAKNQLRTSWEISGRIVLFGLGETLVEIEAFARDVVNLVRWNLSRFSEAFHQACFRGLELDWTLANETRVKQHHGDQGTPQY